MTAEQFETACKERLTSICHDTPGNPYKVFSNAPVVLRRELNAAVMQFSKDWVPPTT